MATVFDVAKYILLKMGKISTWKLQKLCYYSQAWQIAWTGYPIFDEDFEAWANGPVCPQLFHAHQGRYNIESDNINGNEENLNSDQKETIDIIIREYGSMEPYQLREQTHSEKPWRYARGECKEGDYCNTVISKESMGSYYGSL